MFVSSNVDASVLKCGGLKVISRKWSEVGVEPY